jgi:hypothetical protein
MGDGDGARASASASARSRTRTQTHAVVAVGGVSLTVVDFVLMGADTELVGAERRRKHHIISGDFIGKQQPHMGRRHGHEHGPPVRKLEAHTVCPARHHHLQADGDLIWRVSVHHGGLGAEPGAERRPSGLLGVI